MSIAVEEHLALDPHAVDEVVHAVQAAQERGLAAAGGPDERRDPPRQDVQVDVVERLLLAVEEVELLDLDDGLGLRRRRARCRWPAACSRSRSARAARPRACASRSPCVGGASGCHRLHPILRQNVAVRSFRRSRSRMRIAVRLSAMTTREQQERRHVDHRLGRLDVGRLEPDVVDVESQVHELALEVEEGGVAVERQLRRELDDAR